MQDDLLYFQDEQGKEVGLIMIDNFDFEGKNYALLTTPEETEESGIYVMRMEDKDGELSFSMPQDEEMEKLTPVIMEHLEAMNDSCGHDCCSCGGCHHEEDSEECSCGDDCEEGCSCGCEHK